MRVHGDARNVRAGDILLCTDPGSWFSAGIRFLTASEASHAALVTCGDCDRGNFSTLEVGWRIRAARISEFPEREWIAYRPRKGALPLAPIDGQIIVRNLLARLADGGALGALYPWWHLPAYLFGRGLRGRMLLPGARQVCSVTTIWAAVAYGVDVWCWDGDQRRELLTQDDVESITPADLIRNAIEQGWQEIAWTDGAPVI
jgi:hypothetical protein